MVQPGKRRSVQSGLAMASVLSATVAALLVAVAAPAQAQTFSNSGTITIPDPNCTDPDAAIPYPSEINVGGLVGTISDVNVRLNGVSHTFQEDIDVLLVGPAGQNLLVVSDAGTGLASANNVTITFDDAAAADIPQTQWGSPGSSVTYRPKDYDPGAAVDTFPTPAPAPSAATTLATFNGSDPNGIWKLFVIDDACDTGGSIAGGWTLDITVAASAAATTTNLTSTPNPSLTGQSVTFTATVTTTAGGSPVTTGTVTFTEGATTLAANVPLNGSGQASFSTSTLPEGNHIIVATYNGTASFATSNDDVNQRIDNATTVNGSTYCNPGAITIPAVGTATPYPSNIFVTGAPNPLGKVTVQLKNVTHPFAEDLDVLLVGPSAQNVVLASDAGNGTAATSNVTVTFDDAAAADLPATGAWGAPNSSVTARPKDYDPGGAVDTFPAPAPAPIPATTLSIFNGLNPNTTWSLYVVDDSVPDSGSIAGGWCITFTPPQADVSVTKTDSPDPVVAGQNITYTITVANTVAGSTAANVALTDAIPTNTTFVSRNVPAGWNCASQTVGSTDPLSCSRASLTPADGAQVFTLVVNVNAATTGSVTNTATVSATGDTAAAGNNVATAATAVNAPQPTADVSVTKTDSPDPVVAGQNITYTITVANSVPGSTATNVGLSDLIPANTTFVSRVVPGGWTCAAQAVGSTDPLSCTRATLTPADGAQTFTLVVRVNNQTPSGENILNTAAVNANEDPIPAGNNLSTTSTAVTFPISKPGIVRSSVNWKLRNSLTSGPPENEFTYGTTPLAPLIGDWDGDGTNTAGTFESGTFKLNNANDGSAPDIVFAFGDPRGFPVAGDFNGDGTDDVAVYRNGVWQIRLSNGTVLPSFSFGSGSWPFTVPVAGDWDGDGTDGIGTFAVFAGADPAGTWRLRNTATAGSPDVTFMFLPVADAYPVVGDWDGDGIDTVGVKQRSTALWLLSNSNSAPVVAITFQFGQNGDLPLAW